MSAHSGSDSPQSPGNLPMRNSQFSGSEEEEKIIYVRVTLYLMDGVRIGQKTFELDGSRDEPSLGAILAFARSVLPVRTDQQSFAQKNNVANVIFSYRPGGDPIQCIVEPHRKIRLFIDDLPTVSCGGGDDTDNSPVFSLLATVVRKLDERAV